MSVLLRESSCVGNNIIPSSLQMTVLAIGSNSQDQIKDNDIKGLCKQSRSWNHGNRDVDGDCRKVTNLFIS